MTPFQELRLWATRASSGDRVAAALAVAVVVGLLAWALFPAGESPDDTVVAGVGADPTARGSPEASGATTTITTTQERMVGGAAIRASGAGTTPVASAAGPSPAPIATNAGGGCVPPPGTDQGITPAQVKIAILLIELAGSVGNSTAGIPTVDEQQSDYQAVIDNINASGGVACRKLVAQFFKANPLDQTDLQRKCLDVAQASVAAAVDLGNYGLWPALATCFPQHQIPFFMSLAIPNKQKDQYYPYMFASASTETMYRNTVFALKARGFFGADNGFNKLGFIYRDCSPEIVSAENDWLHQAGVASDQIVTYNVGCPAQFASPGDLAQAVLKFQQNGVTHVTTQQFTSDWQNFTKIAQQQNFKPKYGLADDGIEATTYSSSKPDHDNIANAVIIAGTAYGEERTPGFTPSAGTIRCNAIYNAVGRKETVHERQDVGISGVACNQMWMVAAAIGHAPTMQRTAFAAGLQASKSVDFSFPWGPSDFRGPRVTTGGQFWRPLQFLPSCSCWRIIDPVFRPSFP